MHSISVACFDQSVWIRVTGRGNFQCSASLKELVQKMNEKGHCNYVLDLIECHQMDSTFMGTITGIIQRLRQGKKGTMKVVNVSSSNQELMENLGLDHIFPIHPLSLGRELPPSEEEHCFCEPLIEPPSEKDKKAVQEIVISAHEVLVAADKKNAEKFKDFFEAMK